MMNNLPISANKKFKYSITFQSFNEESLEAGDSLDNGYEIEQTIDLIGDILYEANTRYGIYMPVSFGTWESTEPEQDRDFFEKGISKYYALHLTNEDGTEISQEESDFISFLLSDGRYEIDKFRDYAVGGIVLGAIVLGVGALITYFYFKGEKSEKGLSNNKSKSVIHTINGKDRKFPIKDAWRKEHSTENKSENYEVPQEDRFEMGGDASEHYHEVEYGEGGVARAKDVIINKIGFNEYVADYLVGTSEKFAIWLADTILKDGIKETNSSKKDVLKVFNERSKSVNNNFITSVYSSNIREILDWLQHPLTPKQNLKELSFDQALEKARDWHQELQVLGGDIDFTEPETNQILKKYPVNSDGIEYYWAFIPSNYCDLESSRMGHCGRTGYGNKLISLRSVKPYGKGHTISDSHVTIAYGSDGMFYQVKGKKNNKPAEKYFPYIFDLIKTMLTDEEIKHKFNEDDSFTGFGNEYQSSEDYGFEDMSKEQIREVYDLKPTLFESAEDNYMLLDAGVITLDEFKEIVEREPDTFSSFGNQMKLYERGIITEQPSTSFELTYDCDDVYRLLEIDTDFSDDLVSQVLCGDVGELYDGWGHYYDNPSDLVSNLNKENEQRVIDEIVRITKLDESIVKENGIEHYLSNEDDDFPNDNFDNIIRTLASAQNQADNNDYHKYLYDAIESALNELGTVHSLNDEGVKMTIELSNNMSFDEIAEGMDYYEFSDVEDLFNEKIGEDFDKPRLRIDDRYSPYGSSEDFNDYVSDTDLEQGYKKGGYLGGKNMNKNMKIVQTKLKEGGNLGYSKKDYFLVIKNWVYFTFNYPMGFVKDAFSSSHISKHLQEKFSSSYERFGSVGVLMSFWANLDGKNREILSLWIKNNYFNSDSEKTELQSISDDNYAKIITHWNMFCFNFPHNFVEKVFEDNSEHFENKWVRSYERAGSTGAVNKFFTELSGNNQRLLTDWVYDNYKHTRFADGGRVTTNDGIIEAFLTSNKQLKVGNLSTHFNEYDNEMLLRNYGTLIATRKGNDVSITNTKYSKTTTIITNKVNRMALDKGMNVNLTDKFAEGGEAGLKEGVYNVNRYTLTLAKESGDNWKVTIYDNIKKATKIDKVLPQHLAFLESLKIGKVFADGGGVDYSVFDKPQYLDSEDFKKISREIESLDMEKHRKLGTHKKFTEWWYNGGQEVAMKKYGNDVDVAWTEAYEDFKDKFSDGGKAGDKSVKRPIRKKRQPKVARTQFEEQTYEYKKGGSIKGIKKKAEKLLEDSINYRFKNTDMGSGWLFQLESPLNKNVFNLLEEQLYLDEFSPDDMGIEDFDELSQEDKDYYYEDWKEELFQSSFEAFKEKCKKHLDDFVEYIQQAKEYQDEMNEYAGGGRVKVGVFDDNQLRNKEDKKAVEKAQKETGLNYVDTKIKKKGGKMFLEVYLISDEEYYNSSKFAKGGEISSKELNLNHQYTYEIDEDNNGSIYKEAGVYFVQGFENGKHFSETFERFKEAKDFYVSKSLKKHAKGGGVDDDEDKELLDDLRKYIYEHRHTKGITAEIIDKTKNGFKVKQIDEYGWGNEKKKTPKTTTAFYTDKEFSDLFKIKWLKDGYSDGGGVNDVSYEKVFNVLKSKIDDSIDEMPMDYENSSSFTSEEIEHESRDGFIPYTDGGYQAVWFEYLSGMWGAGKTLPTKQLDNEMNRQIDYNLDSAKENFIKNYPEIVEELGEENIDYNSLYEAGYGEEAEELSNDENEMMSEDTIMMRVFANYYNPENSRAKDGKHTIRLFGDVNLESPYHRTGNLDDSYEYEFTFDSISELENEMDKGLKQVISWFEGDMYNDSDAEMKVRRMKKGGRLSDKATYLGKRDIESIRTVYGQTIAGKKLLDGNYVKGKLNKPKMSRLQFEEEVYEYAEGGLIVKNNSDLEDIAKYMTNAVKKHHWDLKDLIVYFEKENNFDYKKRVKVWEDMNGYEMKKTYNNIYEMLKRISEANGSKYAEGGEMNDDDDNDENDDDDYAEGGEIEDWMEEALESLMEETGSTDLEISIVSDNGNEFYATDNKLEYRVFKTEDDAEEKAIEGIREDMEESPENFNQDFLVPYIDGADFFKEALDEMNYSYAEDIASESDSKYANRLIAELVENGLMDEDDAESENAEEVADDLKSDYVDLLTEQQLEQGNNGLDYFISNFGEEETMKMVIDNNLIDIDKASRDAVNSDGIAHFLSSYDGETLYLSDDYVAYRVN